MADKVKHKRGLLADLPALEDGQLGYATDAKKLFVGNSGTNDEIGKNTFAFPADPALTSADIGKLLMNDGGLAKLYQLTPTIPEVPFTFTITQNEPSQPGTPPVPGQQVNGAFVFTVNPSQNDQIQMVFGGGQTLVTFIFDTTQSGPTPNWDGMSNLEYFVTIGMDLSGTLTNLQTQVESLFGPPSSFDETSPLICFVDFGSSSLILTVGSQSQNAGSAGNGIAQLISNAPSIYVTGVDGANSLNGGVNGEPAILGTYYVLTDDMFNTVSLPSPMVFVCFNSPNPSLYQYAPGIDANEDAVNLGNAIQSFFNDLTGFLPGSNPYTINVLNNVITITRGNFALYGISVSLNADNLPSLNTINTQAGVEPILGGAQKTYLGELIGLSDGMAHISSLSVFKGILSGPVTAGQSVSGDNSGKVRVQGGGVGDNDTKLGYSLQDGIADDVVLISRS